MLTTNVRTKYRDFQMKLSKRQLKQMVREEYNRIHRRRRIMEAPFEGYDGEIVDSLETERPVSYTHLRAHET